MAGLAPAIDASQQPLVEIVSGWIGRQNQTNFPLAWPMLDPMLVRLDLQHDPHELHNLAEDPSSTVTLNTLRAKLRAWQERTADPWLIKYRHE